VELTPTQARALRVARQVLTEREAQDVSPVHHHTDAYWVGRLSQALRDVAEALPEDAS
jgi:hypothetical protein